MKNPQAQDLPEFWHIFYPVKLAGGTYYYGVVGQDEYNSRELAVKLSREYVNATINNRQGLFAAYTNGVETASASAKVTPQAKASKGNLLTKLRSLLK